ncbi:hypothetical protein LZ30DRAFT_361149 [Colletotrichum cereale]|nr:hypothetical protein LZ30DRAFT_361149 [Colletotrichum cereale]
MPASLAAWMCLEEYEMVVRQTMWRLDLAIMPIVVIIYVRPENNYLDHRNTASTKPANITTDPNVSGVQHRTTYIVFFVGNIIMQVPSNVLVGGIKCPGVCICGGIACWSIIFTLITAVYN